MFKQKIANKESGILTYGMTPPKAANEEEKLAEIAQRQIERLTHLDIDALILYDVQEEADREEHERPFPYLPTMDPAAYSDKYLGSLDVSKIIYRCVGNYTEEQFIDWIASDAARDKFSVYVGASSHKQEVKMDLSTAYKLSKPFNSHLSFGGVVIPERHMQKNDEHLRVVHKINHGCQFFISQATYNVEASKNFLSDYYYYCEANEIEMVPILFNIAPCGSEKTLAFMKWLGISIPKWLENDLRYSKDVLEKSIRLSQEIFEEIFDYGLEKGIPVGCSVESVSTRKVEIDASVQMVKNIKSIMDNKVSQSYLSV